MPSVTIEIRTPGTLTVLESKTINLNADGSYSFDTAVANGAVDVAIKADHWLRSVVSATVTASGASNVDVTLTNGDVDGDNSVTVFDYGILSDAFDSAPGAGNWNAMADVDGDEAVTVFDYGILSDNFDKSGQD